MERIRCFVIEPVPRQTQSISVHETGTCPAYHGRAEYSSHWARVELGESEMTDDRAACPSLGDESLPWPTQCPCGHVFTPAAHRSSSAEQMYRHPETGAVFRLRDAPPGALWRATWFEDAPAWCGADGQAWICKTPGGEWHIDGRASNCTRKDDDVHKCWVRTGTAPDFTVGKGGNTCSAGAGSILCGGYHGFLRSGYLERC